MTGEPQGESCLPVSITVCSREPTAHPTLSNGGANKYSMRAWKARARQKTDVPFRRYQRIGGSFLAEIPHTGFQNNLKLMLPSQFAILRSADFRRDGVMSTGKLPKGMRRCCIPSNHTEYESTTGYVQKIAHYISASITFEKLQPLAITWTFSRKFYQRQNNRHDCPPGPKSSPGPS